MTDTPQTPLFTEVDISSLPEPAALVADEAIGPASDVWVWNNFPVNIEGGVILNTPQGRLRAREIEIEITDCHWRYSFDLNGSTILTPRGNRQQAGGGWFAPFHSQFGIVYVNGGIGTIYEGPNRYPIQKPDQDIRINVNDKKGTYSDNSGSFDLRVKVLRR